MLLEFHPPTQQCKQLDFQNWFILTHPLLQFCVVWGQELHEEFMLDWVQFEQKRISIVLERFRFIESVAIPIAQIFVELSGCQQKSRWY